MGNTNFSQAVSEILNNLVEVIKKDYKISLKTQPTEKLINDMQSILDELKRRVSLPVTKTLRDLPFGAKIVDKNTKYYGTPIVWLVADHDYYAPSSTTLVSERILTFKSFDASEPNNPDEWRADFGNNNYKVSNIAQWLNSYGDDWFIPLHNYDKAPTLGYVSSRPYANESGFLTNFSEDFIQSMIDSLVGKVFLLSDEEVGLADGKRLALFENEEYRKAKLTKECVQIDNLGVDENKPNWWWLRTPNNENSYYTRYVNAYGKIHIDSACYGCRGVRPALNISSDVRVKDEPDENGVYEIVWS